jgi:hypothetical protein
MQCLAMTKREDPVNTEEAPILVRGTVTGFEQGIAALAGLFTAGPLGALASWATIRGVQGKWTPWFILGIPSAIAINAFYFGIFSIYMNTATRYQQEPIAVSVTPREVQQLRTPDNSSNVVAATAQHLEGAQVSDVQDSTPRGLRIAAGVVTYNDGDVLSGKFRIYCPTSQIRPIDYVLTSSSGVIKKSGSWWEESFAPKYKAENELVAKTCGN